jgi:hypothetical protein
VSTRQQRAVRRCAEWLAYCLSIGWSEGHLDALEKLWWKYHDLDGNLFPKPRQRGPRPSPRERS